MKPVRCVFLGTAPLARMVLKALLDQEWIRIAGVVTQPDRPSGRRLGLEPTAVKAEALERGLPVWQPESLGRDAALLDRLGELAPDLLVTAAYGQLLTPQALAIPSRGALNVHASLLPRYRGAAPAAWAVVRGEAETGITIMEMDQGLDTGGILLQERTPIGREETGGELLDRLSPMGARLLLRAIPPYLSGKLRSRPQDHSLATHAPQLSRRDGEMDWERPAAELACRIRGLSPWPGTWSRLETARGAERILFWKASPLEGRDAAPGTVVRAGPEGLVVACGEGSLRMERLQRAGGRALDARSFLSGRPLDPGSRFLPPARNGG